MKPLGNERQHSLSRKETKAQRKAGKAKGRQTGKRQIYDDIDCHPNYDASTDSIREAKDEY